MKRIMAVALLILTLGATPALADGVTGGVGDDEAPTDEIRHYDREGTAYKCLHYDSTMGCLYAVEGYENGFMLYFVTPEGDRIRRWLPTEMVAGDPYERFTRSPTHYYAYPCVDY